MSFRKDWLDLLAVQGTLKSLLQHHGSKASILRLLHPWNFPGKSTGVGCHFLLQGNRIEIGSPALQADSLPTEL